jgi:DNA-directed RNA polymerase specialized sigma24 family protein
MMSNEWENCENYQKSLFVGQTRETILKRLDVYIRMQVKRTMSQHPLLVQREVKDLEIDEIVQRVRIKFWRMLEKGYVRFPHAYVTRIIYSEIIDMLRRQKVTLALPGGESEEYHEILNGPDPADEVIQRMDAVSLLSKVVPLVLELPPRQRLAMICQLQDQVDDLVQLIETFKTYRVDIEALQWPTEKAERQLLRASLSAARRNLAREYQKKRIE